jgi:hypothetical protein
VFLEVLGFIHRILHCTGQARALPLEPCSSLKDNFKEVKFETIKITLIWKHLRILNHEKQRWEKDYYLRTKIEKG